MQVIGQQAFTPDALPTSGSIRGISTRLLLAVWGNGDSHIQYLRNAGLPQLLQLCTRSLSTDTIEGSFAELNSSICYKGTPQQLQHHLRRLDLRWSIRHESSQVFYAMQSRRSRQYSHHALAAVNDGWYDDGWQSEGTTMRQCKVQKVADKKAKGGEISVRARHNF